MQKIDDTKFNTYLNQIVTDQISRPIYDYPASGNDSKLNGYSNKVSPMKSDSQRGPLLTEPTPIIKTPMDYAEHQNENLHS